MLRQNPATFSHSCHAKFDKSSIPEAAVTGSNADAACEGRGRIGAVRSRQGSSVLKWKTRGSSNKWASSKINMLFLNKKSNPFWRFFSDNSKVSSVLRNQNLPKFLLIFKALETLLFVQGWKRSPVEKISYSSFNDSISLGLIIPYYGLLI